MPPMNVAIWNLKVKCNTLHINTPQKKKYLSINITKCMQYIYVDNFKTGERNQR